jgi:hypothetical protein
MKLSSSKTGRSSLERVRSVAAHRAPARERRRRRMVSKSHRLRFRAV